MFIAGHWRLFIIQCGHAGVVAIMNDCWCLAMNRFDFHVYFMICASSRSCFEPWCGMSSCDCAWLCLIVLSFIMFPREYWWLWIGIFYCLRLCHDHVWFTIVFFIPSRLSIFMLSVYVFQYCVVTFHCPSRFIMVRDGRCDPPPHGLFMIFNILYGCPCFSLRNVY